MALGLVLVVALRRASSCASTSPSAATGSGAARASSRASSRGRRSPRRARDGTDVVVTLADRREVRLWCDTEDPWVAARCVRASPRRWRTTARRARLATLTTLARGDRPYAAWRPPEGAGDRPNDYRSRGARPPTSQKRSSPDPPRAEHRIRGPALLDEAAGAGRVRSPRSRRADRRAPPRWRPSRRAATPSLRWSRRRG